MGFNNGSKGKKYQVKGNLPYDYDDDDDDRNIVINYLKPFSTYGKFFTNSLYLVQP
jgi:hypothetical protein